MHTPPPPPPRNYGSNLPPHYQPSNNKGNDIDWKFYAKIAMFWVLGNFVVSFIYFISNVFRYGVWEFEALRIFLTFIEWGILVLPIIMMTRQPSSSIKTMVIVFAALNLLMSVIQNLNFWFHLY